jgi:hypothetical protein
MSQLRFLPATFAASAVFLFSSLSSAIVAPEPGCGDGAACGVGFECSVVGASGSCGSTPPCAPGAECPEPEPCVTTELYGCTPAHCSVNAECASGMVCHAWVQGCAQTDCACAPDVPDCGCGASTACEAKTVSMCTPRYLLPCQVAADCGEGFTCEAQMTDCASSGSSGASDPLPGGSGAAPAPAGGSAGVPSEPLPVAGCDPQPTGQLHCVAKPINCTSAAQCPAGWSCEQEVNVTSPACAPGENCEARPAPEPVSAVCRPPYYGSISSDDLETPTTSNGQGTGTKDGGTVSGTPGGTPNPEATNDDSPSSNESAACQMGHAPASSGVVSLLTLLGALFGLQRRRTSQR